MRQRISNLEEFKTLQKACIRARENEKRKVLVCCGTGCAAGGNLKVFDELKAQMDAQGVPCEIALNLTECGGSVTGLKKSGCHGFCEMGPLVRIEPEGWLSIRSRPAACWSTAVTSTPKASKSIFPSAVTPPWPSACSN